MTMNKIYNEDCFITNQRNLDYDYVITSPPDFEELEKETITDEVLLQYKTFLKQRLSNLNPKNKFVTIFVSNRKANKTIIQKNIFISEIMEELGWNLHSQKIWVKTYKIDLYRPGFTYILTFNKPNFFTYKHLPDVFYEEFEPTNNEYTYNFSKKIVKQFIENHTKIGQVIYDPFMGSGTTAVACLELERNYYGAEINKDTFELSQKQISVTNTLNKFI